MRPLDRAANGRPAISTVRFARVPHGDGTIPAHANA